MVGDSFTRAHVGCCALHFLERQDAPYATSLTCEQCLLAGKATNRPGLSSPSSPAVTLTLHGVIVHMCVCVCVCATFCSELSMSIVHLFTSKWCVFSSTLHALSSVLPLVSCCISQQCRMPSRLFRGQTLCNIQEDVQSRRMSRKVFDSAAKCCTASMAIATSNQSLCLNIRIHLCCSASLPLRTYRGESHFTPTEVRAGRNI
jgi:hypothetical protein